MYPEQIDELGFTFKKIAPSSIKKINCDNVMIVALTSMGGMGYAGTARLFILEGNEIRLFFIELSNSKIVEIVKTIFPPIAYIYPKKIGLTEKYYEGWSKIGMGAGNLLMVRKELFGDIKKELTGDSSHNNSAHIYKNWCKAAYRILQKTLTRKD